MLLYLFFGGLTFVISVITYAFFNVSLGMNELVANIFSWILAVLFAFFTNRIWVFDGKTNGDLTSAQAGSIGGEMVKKMIMKQEEQMSGK